MPSLTRPASTPRRCGTQVNALRRCEQLPSLGGPRATVTAARRRSCVERLDPGTSTWRAFPLVDAFLSQMWCACSRPTCQPGAAAADLRGGAAWKLGRPRAGRRILAIGRSVNALQVCALGVVSAACSAAAGEPIRTRRSRSMVREDHRRPFRLGYRSPPGAVAWRPSERSLHWRNVGVDDRGPRRAHTRGSNRSRS